MEVNLLGRETRVIVRKGFKLSPQDIEDVITNSSYISECLTVQVDDLLDEHVPMAFVVKKSDCFLSDEDVLEYLNDYYTKHLKENLIPKYTKIVNELKLTSNNKYDYKFYEDEGNLYVDSLNKNCKIKGKTK